MKRLRLGFLLLAIGLGAQASAASWGWLGSEKNGTQYYIDTASIALIDNHPVAWVKINFATPQKVLDTRVRTARYFYYFDCENSQIAIKSIKSYAANDRFVGAHEFDISDLQWKSGAPETLNGELTKEICAKFHDVSSSSRPRSVIADPSGPSLMPALTTTSSARP